MVRYRRYRAFVVFAIVSVFAFYYFSERGQWSKSPASPSLDGSGYKAPVYPEHVVDDVPIGPGIDQAEQDDEQMPAAVESPTVEQSLESVLEAETSTSTSAVPLPVQETSLSQAAQTSRPLANHHVDDEYLGATPVRILEPEDRFTEEGQGRHEVKSQPSVGPPIHWSKLPEHFPVSSTIQLPQGSPRSIPRIQAKKFSQESDEEKALRLQKLQTIKDAATHSWEGYRKHAWMHDEVRPVSGGYRDPFCGWSATLVDALDTLWIMGMMDEFDEAVRAVGTIDFTTSPRKDIPLFETTIRYLGGLLAAYDISQGKYITLLDKAVELAEILMGAFDTPNRMPVTFYNWMPTFASQPHRAGTRVVLAEIGSLSMEFTRLAQITKEPKYYDAVDRITDAFLEWQENTVNATLLPGLWPLYVDASGCEKPAQIRPKVSKLVRPESIPLTEDNERTADHPVQAESRPANDASLTSTSELDPADYLPVGAAGIKGNILGSTRDEHDDTPSASTKHKRQLGGELADITSPSGETGQERPGIATDESVSQQQNAIGKTKPTFGTYKEVCIPRGLVSAGAHGVDKFTLGGMADSVYEYLPKEYLLLGGLEPKYKTMYERAIDAAIEKLIYRPMTPTNADILFSGEYTAYDQPDIHGDYGVLSSEGAHLTCFAGGMFAMGAKIFNREQDLEIGAKLTEGCAWAYNITATGIMPEQFMLLACKDMNDCTWNETRYYEALDNRPVNLPKKPHKTKPKPVSSSTRPDAELVETDSEMESHQDTPVKQAASRTVDPETADLDEAPAAVDYKLKKRQDEPAPAVGVPRKSSPAPAPAPQNPPKPVSAGMSTLGLLDSDEGSADQSTYHPPPRLSQEEHALKRIRLEKLPPGMTKVGSRKYILRPEAIESVFYMYRISGDPHWRDVGWSMFEAIQLHTLARLGYSAIEDVTVETPRQDDTEESFWLAETLKYFYLLFSDEDVLSLDEWVLNTEAHPFRRPDA